MNKEQIKYEDYTLDPNRDVLVPMSTYLALTNVIQAVEREHSKVIQTDKTAFFNRKTNKKLSNKNKAKLDPEKLAKEYYENIDIEETTKSERVDRDQLGTAAVRLLGEFRGVFRHNIDQGNGVLKPQPLPNQPTE